MKRNPALRLGAIVLVLSVISISLATGTFAKYTTSIVGLPETVTAAKFEFNLKDSAAGEEYVSGESFEIFQYSDTGVYGGGGAEGLIAPGTTGDLPLYVENLSQVKVTLEFDIDETNSGNIPIYYTLDTGATPGTIRYSQVLAGLEYAPGVSYQSLDALEAALGEPLDATDGTPAGAYVKDYVLHWNWAFDNIGTVYDNITPLTNDQYDTAIGILGSDQVTLDITATVTQVDI